MLYKMYVWRKQPSWVVMVHATCVEEARKLALVECNGDGDESTPVRSAALEQVRTMNPEVHYRTNAEFVLTDSAELQEMEAYAYVLGERIRELTGKAGVTIEEYRRLHNAPR